MRNVPCSPRPAWRAEAIALSNWSITHRACVRKDSPASVVRTPRGPRSNKVTPRFSSSILMRLLTPDCRTPSALAAALKLRYSATTSAWTTETRSIPRDNSRQAKKRFSSSANVMRLLAISNHNLESPAGILALPERERRNQRESGNRKSKRLHHFLRLLCTMAIRIARVHPSR